MKVISSGRSSGPKMGALRRMSFCRGMPSDCAIVGTISMTRKTKIKCFFGILGTSEIKGKGQGGKG